MTWNAFGIQLPNGPVLAHSQKRPALNRVEPFVAGYESGRADKASGSRQIVLRESLYPGRLSTSAITAAGSAVGERHAGERFEERRLEPDWNVVVGRCLGGDSMAWTELVRAHHRRVYSLCYRFTGCPQDSEDLTQDVFLKIYANLHTFDGTRGSFQVWIATLTRNLLVDHFRRSRQQRATDSIDAGWDDPEQTHVAERLTDSRPSPHENAAAQELQKMVQQALTQISPELREAVILRDLQDLDYKEIAQVLHIPEGTVKSRISRGRAELARLLERNKKQVV
ncbi:MAG TPA: RNA polymerase sigma factor [Acidisarcina sp.]|nr:RNA polymerase sigma factor [Acidisarcina sp.]